MADPDPDSDAATRDARSRLPPAVARLLHPDGATLIEVSVRRDRMLLHELSVYDRGLVTGCGAVQVGDGATELLAYMVACGYLSGRNALDGLDAVERGLPPRTIASGARAVVELITSVRTEVERQRREQSDESEEKFDA